MLKSRTFTVVCVSASNPQGYNPDGAQGKAVKYSGRRVSVKM
jgi:hypothetical protein